MDEQVEVDGWSKESMSDELREGKINILVLIMIG